MSSHIKNIKFMLQVILEIWLPYHFESLWAYLRVPNHVHLKRLNIFVISMDACTDLKKPPSSPS